jgi:hypothetical protein
MSNPQGSGKQGRKDARVKASWPHEEAAAGVPERREHHQPGQSTRPHGEKRPHGEQGQPSHRPVPAHSSQTSEDE